MRSLKALYTIPAHRSNVSDVRFFRAHELPRSTTEDIPMTSVDDTPSDSGPEKDEEEKYRSGLYLASAGYDGFVKIWSADDWQLLRTLSTDAGKVMSVDVSSDGRLLASGTYNRNYQLYAPESNVL